MLHSFDYYQYKMIKDSKLKITRISWNDRQHYIYWDDMRQAYAEHKRGYPDMEWCWNDYSTAYEDLTTSDWRQV